MLTGIALGTAIEQLMNQIRKKDIFSIMHNKIQISSR